MEVQDVHLDKQDDCGHTNDKYQKRAQHQFSISKQREDEQG
jgi:hypothetical protein